MGTNLRRMRLVLGVVRELDGPDGVSQQAIRERTNRESSEVDSVVLDAWVRGYLADAAPGIRLAALTGPAAVHLTAEGRRVIEDRQPDAPS